MTAQTKIDTEVDAMKILAGLLEFDAGVIWTLQTFADFLRWEQRRVDRAMGWLIKRELAAKNLGSYVRTEAGREHYAGAVHKSVMQVSVQAFKTEVLTNMDLKGDMSKIENAALPKGGSHPSPVDTTPEDLCLKCEEPELYKKLEKRAAKLLKVTLTEFRKLLKDGRIRECNGGGSPHLGRFWKHGKGLQHLCVECLRRQRKEKR